MSIPARLVVATSDLNARARVLDAVGDREVVFTGPLGFSGAVDGTEVLVLDLDEGGRDALEELEAVRARGTAPVDVVGFMSHVDRELGRAAREAGCRPIARGRFWTHLAESLGSTDP